MLFRSASQPEKNSDTLIIDKLEQDLEQEQVKYKTELEAHEATKTLLDIQKDNNEKLKIPFHNINDAKLKQLMSFHNDATCYGPSLNFTHPRDKTFSHCIAKELLAKRFLKFMEELEIIESTGGMDYSPAKAKDELTKWQVENYSFEEDKAGWYNNIMLGYLIIEYSKKS